MSAALTGLVIFLGLQVTLVAVLVGMAKWEQLAEPPDVLSRDERRPLEMEPAVEPVLVREGDAA